MTRRDLIDPESRVPLDALLEVLPGGFNAIPDIGARRATVEQMLAMMPAPENPGVSVEDRTVPGPEGAPDVRVRIYRPDGATGPLPGVYYIHGGGMVLGTVEGEEASAMRICHGVGAVASRSTTGWRRSTPIPHRSRTATRACSGRRRMPTTSASTPVVSGSTGRAPVAGWLSARRCCRATGAGPA